MTNEKTPPQGASNRAVQTDDNPTQRSGYAHYPKQLARVRCRLFSGEMCKVCAEDSAVRRG